MHLTENQFKVLEVIWREVITTRQIAERLGSPFNYDQVHSILKRLEKRKIVQRVSKRPARWNFEPKAINPYIEYRAAKLDTNAVNDN